MKVGWYDFQEWEREEVEQCEFDVETYSESLSKHNFGKDHDVITVFASSKVDREVLDEVRPDVVCTRSTGFDHIDLEACEELGIEVYNVPHYGSNAVAEQAFALLLALSRKIPSAVKRTQQEFSHEGLEGFELDGKKFGVIGTGDIGRKAIKMAKGFEMDVIACDPYGDDELEEELRFMYVSMSDLLRQSDIISLHVPLTSSTRHLLDAPEFDQMENTVIINTARGEIINSEALLEALEKGKVKAAGLDVLEAEDKMEKIKQAHEDTCQEYDINCKLINRDDVFVTPHNAFNTIEAKQRILETTFRNIRERPEENRVNM